MIRLQAGALSCALAPELGGALLSLSLGDRPLLRPSPAGATDPLAMASFPLVPYANRIAQGRFTHDGELHQLPLNFGDHPHSIHGLGWQRAWQVAEASTDRARIVQHHAGMAGWPWPYAAEQIIALTPDMLSLTLRVTNSGDSAMPLGLGFHPYFAADAATRLCFNAKNLWLSSPDMLPERSAPADHFGDWTSARPVAGDRLIDNVYEGWDGTAHILHGDDMHLTLQAERADWLHLYRPPGASFFCVEPVTHRPDAINAPGGMALLEPGQSRSLAMRITVGKCDETLPHRAGLP